MDTEDLFPRVALAATIIAAAYIYTRRRGKRLKEVAAGAPAAAQEKAVTANDTGTALAARSQNILENVLDNVAEEALKQLKVVVKDGLHRLEKVVDEL